MVNQAIGSTFLTLFNILMFIFIIRYCTGNSFDSFLAALHDEIMKEATSGFSVPFVCLRVDMSLTNMTLANPNLPMTAYRRYYY
jgi:hypothetical protein